MRVRILSKGVGTHKKKMCHNGMTCRVRAEHAPFAYRFWQAGHTNDDRSSMRPRILVPHPFGQSAPVF